MKFIDTHNWVPADQMHLEEVAMNAIYATGNTLVVAGPGSGKTELLAQKACYLLQTNTCPWPKRILAISFKVDAANNLRARVQKRCGTFLSQRFDSLTFDAFSKGIFDRLRRGLPAGYKIHAYDVNAKMANHIKYAFQAVNQNFYNTVNISDYAAYLTSVQLPFDPDDDEIAILGNVWKYLTQKAKPELNFPMIMRLADLIISSNPAIKQMLQQTYSHVFIDEFQDTTHIQYDLFKTCFFGGNVNFTAVGDDKQTIMEWAGAKPAIFEEYSLDTQSEPLRLCMNWRSAPRLIHFQNYLVETLLHKPAIAIPSDKWDQDQGEVRMCFFADHHAERDYLVGEITRWLQTDGITPREVCILVKQLPPNYTTDLIAALTTAGIRARDESTLQDLLTEPFPMFMINFLESVFATKLGKCWDEVVNFLAYINQSYEDQEMLLLQRRALKFVRELKAEFNNGTDLGTARFTDLMVKISHFTDIKKVKDQYQQYKEGTWLRQMMEQMRDYLMKQYNDSGSMLAALGMLKGEDTVPIMTTHKSKGLEFHTVIFVGLEDSAFWSYTDRPTQDNNLFFVALSRAKERMLFTFSQTRDLPRGGGRQKADIIGHIHELVCRYEGINIVNFNQPDAH
ncbi:UvrD-helicase domain-containing protein [Chitinophaga sp. XS-30]|uniref:UvrD-helicase domain-containing protein n=1 Tax=Chitinophaga sp. XS-30 TaxID=2604421 RepID=UPI0011DD95CC|nr:ATP-dependent helicase [Chitinophaga sp. XS-30]QEH41199.1 ATP-dependent helicase [Chitinophaga sp. XS-30]